MRYLIKIIEFGLYLLVFLLPAQTRWIIKAGETEYLTYSLYGTDVLLIFLLILFIFYRFYNRKITNYELRITNYGLLIAGLLIVSLISVLFAENRVLALYKFGWLVLGAGLFWLVAKAEYSRVKLGWSFFIGLALQAVLGIWQFITQTTFANKWLGLAYHQAAQLGTSVVEIIGHSGITERWLRAYGGLDHPNILGGALAIGVLLMIGEYIGKNFQFSIFNFQTIFNVRIFNYLFWFLLVIFFAGLFFSFSRSAWLALTVGLAIGLIRAIIKKDLLVEKKFLEIILVLGGIFLILFLKYPNLVMTRFYASERLEIKSTNERIVSLKSSWQIIKNNWVVGAGLGNYTLALKRNLPDQPAYFYQPVHNSFLLIWSEIGIVGLLVLVLIILNSVIRNYLEIRNWKLEIGKNFNHKTFYVNLPILIALSVLLCLDHWLWSLHFGVLFFWLLTGILWRQNFNKS